MEHKQNDFLSVINAPEFEAAWDYAVNVSSDYSGFSQLPMPPGCTTQELWGLFLKLRRIAGMPIPITPWVKASTDFSWLHLSRASESRLAGLHMIVNSTSQYNSFIQKNSIDDFWLRSFIFPEIQSLALHDGVVIKNNVLRDAWLHKLKPNSETEQLIFNFEELFHRPEHYAKRRISRDLMEDLYEKLCSDIPDEFIPERKYRFKREFYRDKIFTDSDYVDATLEQVLKAVRNDVYNDDVLSMLQITQFMWDLPLFPRFNRLVEYLVRRIYCVKSKIPILSYVPYSHASDNPKRTYIESQYNAYQSNEAALASREGVDSSLVFEASIEILLESANELVKAIARVEARDKDAVDFITAIPHINHRQRQFLIGAARNERTTYKIGAYQHSFDVAYATARQDLMDLVERGYLFMRKNGKAFEFQIVPLRDTSNKV